MFDRLSEDQRQALNIVREGHNIFWTGQGGTARKNNCLLSSIFPAGEGGFGQMRYWSLERSPQDSREGVFLYSAQASFSWPRVDLARLLRRAYSAYSRSVWIISFVFVKVCGIRFSIWESCILLLYTEWIWTNYCKLSRNFVGAIRTTTINYRVSFIDLYLVFPRNFRMIFLPHTNTVILLEPYCGTITEPGLPVSSPDPLRLRWLSAVIVHL